MSLKGLTFQRDYEHSENLWHLIITLPDNITKEQMAISHVEATSIFVGGIIGCLGLVLVAETYM